MAGWYDPLSKPGPDHLLVSTGGSRQIGRPSAAPSGGPGPPPTAGRRRGGRAGRFLQAPLGSPVGPAAALSSGWHPCTDSC